MRTGIGYDIHRIVPTPEVSQIPIGGVSIPCHYKITAHSDGDVLLHAVVDALLGALALGDIGQWFPDNAAENRGRPSKDFVVQVMKEVRSLGWEVSNVDTIVIAEEPKLGPHRDRIRQEIAMLLGIEIACVGVKAKTMETLGPIGERRAIAAHASILLRETK